MLSVGDELGVLNTTDVLSRVDSSLAGEREKDFSYRFLELLLLHLPVIAQRSITNSLSDATWKVLPNTGTLSVQKTRPI